jgi:hypothetical protein
VFVRLLPGAHYAESRPYVARMRTTEDITRIAAEAYEVIEGDDQT